MDAGIEKLLVRAEVCFEKGQLRMAGKYLQEIVERVEIDDMDEPLRKRFMYLDQEVPVEDQVDDVDTRSIRESAETQGNKKCEHCGGTGMYRNTSMPCYPCNGKGYQTPHDQERCERYWSWRKQLAESRKETANWF